MRALKTVTFIYDMREDRVLAAINAGHAEAWSCWLTRRLAVALLERTADYVANTSALAQRAPANLRGDFVAFERDAAIALTAKAMSITPPDILKSSAIGAELADRVTIANHADSFRLEFHGQKDDGAAGTLTRPELQRILQMLRAIVAKTGWLEIPAKTQTAPAAVAIDAKPVRH